MKIGLFIPVKKYDDYNKVAASIWIRVLQMKKYYESSGNKVFINNYRQKYDVVVFYRLMNFRFFFKFIFVFFRTKKIYFDICTNLFEKHQNNDLKGLILSRIVAYLCNGIICSTDSLVEVAKKYSKSSFVMYDCLEKKYLLHKKNINFDSPMFGWSGVSSKAHFLSEYKNYLDDKTILIADKNIDLGFKYIFYPWKYETFDENLNKCDIGFLPREFNNNYDLHHSSFKALVFALKGIPIIANKLPSYARLSKFYNGIVFLEDYNNSIDECIKELKKRNLEIDKTWSEYSCDNQVKRILKYFTEKL